MSDIEKNELNTPDDSENVNKEDLREELEQLKDLFQKELDNATEEDFQQENQEGERELIQHLDEIDEDCETEESENLPVCECCEENPVSTKYGEGYPYCDSCRSLMAKYPIRSTGVLALILTFVLFFGGLYICQNEIIDSATVLEASVAYSSGHMTTAATAYQTYFSSATSENSSRRAVREAVKAYMALGATNDIVSFIEDNYTEDDLKKLRNKDINDIYNLCLKINATTDAVYNSIVYPAVYGYTSIPDAIDSLKEFIAQIEEGQAAVSTSTDAQQDTQQYDLVVCEYYIYYLMATEDFDNNDRLEQIKKVAEIAEASGENYRWMYAPAMAMIAAEVGELDVVNQCREYIIENNLDDVSAYTSLAHYYYKQEDVDTEKILEVCQQADDAFPEGNEMSHYRYYAAAYLLNGEYEEAFKKMESFTAQGISYVSDANLLALCALTIGDTDVYEEMVSTLENAGYQISDYVEQYKAEKITIEEIFEIGGGDFI